MVSNSATKVTSTSSTKRKRPKKTEMSVKRRRITFKDYTSSDNSAGDGDESDMSDEFEIDWEKLEEVLEENAAKANLTAINVKSILRHVLSDKRVIEYAQNAAENTSNEFVSKTKLTRSKAKLIGQSPLCLPGMQVNEPTFLDLKFPETSSSDEEYKPQDDGDDNLSQASEEESLYSDATLDSCSPRHKASTPLPIVNEEILDNGNVIDSSEIIKDCLKKDEKNVFKIPAVPIQSAMHSSNFEQQIALRTRSKCPMPDIEVQEIEAMFQPPDSDVLDFSPQDKDDPDEIIWKNWLADFMKPLKALNDTNDEQDEDFNYMAADADNEDNEMEEEMRNDKATRVTQKELQELFNELLLGYSQQNLKDDFNSEETLNSNKLLENDMAPISITEATEVLYITFEQRQHILAQMQQHVQLLTQIYMLSCTRDSLRNETLICKQYIEELALFHEKAVENSKNNVGHVRADLSSFCAPGILDAYRIIASLDISTIEPPEIYPKSKHTRCQISRTIAGILCKEPYFATFVELLPAIGMCERKRQKNHFGFPSNRLKFSKFEDHLLALGLEQFKQRGKYELIAEHLLPTKTPGQLRCRVKNLLSRNEISNPVAVLYRDDYLPDLKVKDSIKVPREISTIALVKLPRRIWEGRLVPRWFNSNWRKFYLDMVEDEKKKEVIETENGYRKILPKVPIGSQNTFNKVTSFNLVKPLTNSCDASLFAKNVVNDNNGSYILGFIKASPQRDDPKAGKSLVNGEPESLISSVSTCLKSCLNSPSDLIKTNISTRLSLDQSKSKDDSKTCNHLNIVSEPSQIRELLPSKSSNTRTCLKTPEKKCSDNNLQTPEKFGDNSGKVCFKKHPLAYPDFSLQTPQKCDIFTPQKVINFNSENSDLSQFYLDSETSMKVDNESPAKINKTFEEKLDVEVSSRKTSSDSIFTNSAQPIDLNCPQSNMSTPDNSTHSPCYGTYTPSCNVHISINEVNHPANSLFTQENDPYDPDNSTSCINNQAEHDGVNLNTNNSTHFEISKNEPDKAFPKNAASSVNTCSLQNADKVYPQFVKESENGNVGLSPINTCSSSSSVSLNDKEVADILQTANLCVKQSVSQNKQKDVKEKPRKRKLKEVFNFNEKLSEKAKDLAYIYFKRVKETLIGKPDIVSEFYLVMHKLDTKELNRLDAYYRISELFVDYPELVDNFTGFLEQHEARHVGKFLEWLSFERVLRFQLCCEQAFVSQPGWYNKIIQKIVDVTEISGNSKYIVETVTPMFKGNTTLIHQFIKMFPDLSPPPFYDDDFEVIDFAAVASGAKDIDDFEEILYHPEVEENVVLQDDVKCKKRNKKSLSKFLNNKSNINVTARKLSQLARKKKNERNHERKKVEKMNSLNEINLEENIVSEEDVVEQKSQATTPSKCKSPNCKEMGIDIQSCENLHHQTSNKYENKNQQISNELCSNLSPQDVHFEIISSVINEVIEISSDDILQHSPSPVMENDALEKATLQRTDSPIPTCQLNKCEKFSQKPKSVKRRLNKSELITLSNETDLKKTDLHVPNTQSPISENIVDKDLVTQRLLKTDDEEKTSVAQNKLTFENKERIPMLPNVFNENRSSVVPCLLTVGSDIKNPSALNFLTIIDEKKNEVVKSFAEVDNGSFDCESCELTFPDPLHCETKSYDDLTFDGKITPLRRLGKFDLVTLETGRNEESFEKSSNELISYSIPMHTENNNTVLPIKLSQELCKDAYNPTSNLDSLSSEKKSSLQNVSENKPIADESHQVTIDSQYSHSIPDSVAKECIGWNKEEDMVILTTLRMLGNNEDAFRKITQDLQSKTDKQIKTRIDFLMQMLNELASNQEDSCQEDSSREDSSQSLSVDSDNSNSS